MLHAGLDLSRRKIEVCLLSSVGEIVEEWASPADADGPAGVRPAPRCGVCGCAGWSRDLAARPVDRVCPVFCVRSG
jgi:hypothetical protein